MYTYINITNHIEILSFGSDKQATEAANNYESSNFLHSIFTCHIWNMIGLVTGKIKKKFAYFYFLGLFMTKVHDLSDKKISVCHAPLPV
jgi:hypothetical protein